MANIPTANKMKTKKKLYTFSENDMLVEKMKQPKTETDTNKIRHFNLREIELIEQAQTQTKLECLKSELEFLKFIRARSLILDNESGRLSFVLDKLEERITKIQQEIREIEK